MNYKLQINKSIFALILLIIVISMPLLSFAQMLPYDQTQGIPFVKDPVVGDLTQTPVTGDLSGSGKIVNPIPKISSLTGLIKTILEAVVTIGIPIVTLAIIYCGFLFVKALGKPEELKKAKDALLYTVIGSAILLGAWTIAQLISDTVLEIGK